MAFRQSYDKDFEELIQKNLKSCICKTRTFKIWTRCFFSSFKLLKARFFFINIFYQGRTGKLNLKMWKKSENLDKIFIKLLATVFL